MSKKAKKRLNRFLRVSGRTLANGNNARQHLASKGFQRDMAAGGEQMLEAAALRLIDEEAKRDAELQRLLGVWG